jgi:hypothetical protein
MKKEELALISMALADSKALAIKESKLCELIGKRPALVTYLNEILIPKLDQSIEIINQAYYAN